VCVCRYLAKDSDYDSGLVVVEARHLGSGVLCVVCCVLCVVLSQPEDTIGAKKKFLQSTPFQMLPPGGSICGRST